MSFELKDSELFKEYERACEVLYRLEDITNYKNKEISKCINILSKLNIRAIAEDIYIKVEK